MTFVFWELCYIKNYQTDGKNFPSESDEIPVRMIGFSEDVGHSCTYIVYNEATKQVLHRSVLKKINDGSDINSSVLPHLPPGSHPSPDDPSIEEIVQSAPAHDRRPFSASFNPTELIGRSFLTTNEDGTRTAGEIVDYIENFEDALEGNPDRMKFKVKVGEKKFEEMLDYQSIYDFVEDATQNDDGTYNFRRIVGHRTRGEGKTENIFNYWSFGKMGSALLSQFKPFTTPTDTW